MPSLAWRWRAPGAELTKGIEERETRIKNYALRIRAAANRIAGGKQVCAHVHVPPTPACPLCAASGHREARVHPVMLVMLVVRAGVEELRDGRRGERLAAPRVQGAHMVVVVSWCAPQRWPTLQPVKARRQRWDRSPWAQH